MFPAYRTSPVVTSPVLGESEIVAGRKKPSKRRAWRSTARASPELQGVAERLGERLKALRHNRRLTQEDAANRAQLDAKHYQAVEAGRTNPTLATLVAIAKAFDVTLSGLFKGV